MKQLIVCAGMYRSASTWQFNAIRVIMEHEYGPSKVYSCHYNKYDPDNQSPYHVVKVNRFIEDLALKADLVVTSIRPLDEIKASMQRRYEYLKNKPYEPFRRESLVDEIPSMIKDYKRWKKIALFVQEYKMLKDKELLLAKYQLLLKVPLRGDTPQILEKLNNQMVVPRAGMNDRTLLHAGHITSDKTDLP